MKKLILIFSLIYGSSVISQTSSEFQVELQNLRQYELSELKALEGISPNLRAAKQAEITAKYQGLESKLRTKYNRIENDIAREQEIERVQEQHNVENREIKQQYNSQVLYQMQQKQLQNQRAYQQDISSTLNSLSNTLQATVYNTVKKEMRRREIVATNFANYNSRRIEKINNLYNQIPPTNFRKNLNGQYSGHLFLERRYSFINNQELVTEVPCLVVVENNKIVNLYPYGKKGFELDYPKEMQSASVLSNGIVKYTDFNTLETVTIVLVEPYLSDNPKQYAVNENEVGFVTLYTAKKSDKGRLVWIQEIDGKGNIVREVSTPLVYAKNENDLEEMNIKSLPFNTGNEFHFFGEPVQTPYGVFPLFMKTSKSDTKELEDNERRFIQIKKYRD